MAAVGGAIGERERGRRLWPPCVVVVLGWIAALVVLP
jgi:hypothetical protein